MSYIADDPDELVDADPTTDELVREFHKLCEQECEVQFCAHLFQWAARASDRLVKQQSWWRCRTHGEQPQNAWGCPQCVVELRAQLAERDKDYADMRLFQSKFIAADHERIALHAKLASRPFLEFDLTNANNHIDNQRDRIAELGRQVSERRKLFLDWWLDHHDDSHYFNLMMRADPEAAKAINADSAAHPPNAEGFKWSAEVKFDGETKHMSGTYDPNAAGPTMMQIRSACQWLRDVCVPPLSESDTRGPQIADLIDRLAARLAETQAKHTANHDAWLDEVVRLKRELSEAQKDAERYRWLRDISSETWVPFKQQWCMSATSCDNAVDRELRNALPQRSAIDAARREGN